MKDRIKQLMDDQHLTQQNFAQLIDISAATLCNIFNGKTNPSLSIVDGIHKSFPRVNVYWLLYGVPPMYNDAAPSGGASPVAAEGVGPEAALAAAQGVGAQGGTGGPIASGNGSAPVESSLNFGWEGKAMPARAEKSATHPSLFDQPQMGGVNSTPKNMTRTEIKYIDKPQRKITEIRIFYDDQTWETFVPKKS